MRKILLLLLMSSFMVYSADTAKLTSNTIMDLMSRQRASIQANDATGAGLPE